MSRNLEIISRRKRKEKKKNGKREEKRGGRKSDANYIILIIRSVYTRARAHHPIKLYILPHRGNRYPASADLSDGMRYNA